MSSNRWEHHFAKRRRMAAFTLLELVLVLAILAILALVAVRSLTGVGDQTRFDATRIQLGNINAAVLGTPSAASTDVSNPIFSFVNDNGRLPVAVGNDPASQLRELWTNPNDLPLLAPRQATSYDLDVWIICGWRGSYLQLGIGQTTILDGWGNPYDYLHNDGLTPCVDADPIEIIRSRGAGGQLDTPATTGFNAYQYLAFNSTVPLGSMPPANRYAATLTGNVYFYNSNTGQMENPSLANGDVIVALFGPGGPISANYVSIIAAPEAPNSANPIPATLTYSATGVVTYNFPMMTVGERVVRAYQFASSATSQLPIITVPTYRSLPVRLVVRPGAQWKDLTMLSTSAPGAAPSAPTTQ